MTMKQAAVLAALAVGLGVSACGERVDDDTVSAVCVDGSGDRVDDRWCDGGNGYPGFGWYYYPWYLGVPGLHTQVINNHYYADSNPYGRTAPTDKPVAKALPVSGATAGTKPKAVNPAPKVNSPQDKPNPNVKPGAPANPAPKPPPPAPKAPAPKR